MTAPLEPRRSGSWIGGGNSTDRWAGVFGALGVGLAIVTAIVGLLSLAFFVVFAIGLNSWGNNK